ncbi:hypothetical protein SD77_1430 [Bacillus badius]|uniref:Mobile element protein n=1 Tax=Bacillus badius TaxID=1455 RepID=A0ABR5AS07_BACBA|nr:hypothetical protein SD78_3091 [Bacillus badius]KIL77444.1 hypothetical protein SD77_1430 [Bacillus badius]
MLELLFNQSDFIFYKNKHLFLILIIEHMFVFINLKNLSTNEEKKKTTFKERNLDSL